MRPPTVTVEAVSTVADTANTMTVDTSGLGYLMSILSNMYSDGNLAVVREYASNALDSHVEAGNTGPILVTSPNHFNPILTVQDFGTGLSREEMLEVYAVYLKSTKRNSDDQIGSFGIGAKSAFTVGSQFVVTAVKDGMMTMVLFALDQTGAPTVNVIGHEPTDEPNGVKVEVTVKDVDGVVDAIARLFSTWQPGTVLVDGVEPVHVWDDVEQMVDGIHIGWRVNVPDHQRPASWTLVMGGIPYTLPQSVINAMEYRTRTIVQTIQQSRAVIYLSVPIGSVDITPSREELRLTDKTVATVNAMVEKFHLALGGWVTDQIADAPSLLSAMVKHDELRRNLGGWAARDAHAATWNGQKIPDTAIRTMLEWFRLGRKRGGGMIARRSDQGFTIQPGTALNHVLYITGVPFRKLRSVQITARAFLEAQDAGPMDEFKYVVALPADTTSYALEWFTTADPAVHTMTFDQFIADWKPAQSPSTSRSAVRYNLFHGQPTIPADLKSETTIYYLTHYDRPKVNPSAPLVRNVIGTAPLVLLKSTQKAHVLVKRLPQATNLVTRVQAHAESVLRGVKQADVDALDADQVTRSVDRSLMRWLQEVKAEITHKALRAVIAQYDRAATLAESQSARVDEIRAALRIAGKSQDTLGHSTWDVSAWDKVIDTLPLLMIYFQRDWQRTPEGNRHAVAYINMAEGLTAAATA